MEGRVQSDSTDLTEPIVKLLSKGLLEDGG